MWLDLNNAMLSYGYMVHCSGWWSRDNCSPGWPKLRSCLVSRVCMYCMYSRRIVTTSLCSWEISLGNHICLLTLNSLRLSSVSVSLSLSLARSHFHFCFNASLSHFLFLYSILFPFLGCSTVKLLFGCNSALGEVVYKKKNKILSISACSHM